MRATLQIFTVLLCVCATACTTTQQIAPRATWHNQFAAQQFREIVTDLSAPQMEGRGPGTAGIELARDYIIDRFNQLGLRPAIAGAFTQSLEIKLAVRVREHELAVTDGNGDVLVDMKAGRDFTVLGLSGSGAFDAPVVFAGYGIVEPEHEYDSYGGANVDGKVVIAFRFEPKDKDGRSLWKTPHTARGRWTRAATFVKKAQAAAQRGAVALLVVDPPSHDHSAALRPTKYTVGETVADIPVMHIDRPTLGRILRRAGREPELAMREYEKRANAGTPVVDELERVRVRGQTALDHPVAITDNVVAVLPGTGALADQYVVLGAHYDHLGYGEIGGFGNEGQLHPGADDNASGVAVMLMVAKRLAASQEHDTDRPRRGVIFAAFTGEERGLLGSAHYVSHLEPPGVTMSQITAMIDLDMVGRMQMSTLHVFGSDSGGGWEDMLRDAAEGLALRLKFDGAQLGASDHVSFQVHDVPAVHLFTGSHGDYHRPTDTSDRINARGGALITSFVRCAVDRLTSMPAPMPYVPVSIHAHGSSLQSGGAYLGILPDYVTLDGRDGAGVTAVCPGSPARAAGLARGDRIVRLNDRKILNIHSLTAAMAQSEPGERVVLTVNRGDEVVELKVKLGER
jgi:hypothetical protein